LIEEAYNQEPRVVQHICTAFYYYSGRPRDFAFSFTQEWPIGGQAHQLSYTIPVLSLASGSAEGFGDVLVNYRYQLCGPSGSSVSVAPRFTLILATGDRSKGFGAGVLGYQVNVPMSHRVSDGWVYHVNAGATLLPHAPGEGATGEVKRTLVTYAVGASGIWLAREQLNFILEALVSSGEDFGSSGETERTWETILNPGIRFAINISPMQIVPGLSFPTSFTTGSTRLGILVYLSFEHPF
jgi:hypothetical protein